MGRRAGGLGGSFGCGTAGRLTWSPEVSPWLGAEISVLGVTSLSPGKGGASCPAHASPGTDPAPVTFSRAWMPGPRPPFLYPALPISKNPSEGQNFDGGWRCRSPSVGRTVRSSRLAPCRTYSRDLGSQDWCSGTTKVGALHHTSGARRNLHFPSGFRIRERFPIRSSALGARVRRPQMPRRGYALSPRIPRGASWTAVGSRLPGTGAPRGQGLPCAVSFCAALARGELSPHPHGVRSSIMDSGDFLPGLKGITRIAAAWLSGSGRSSTSNRNKKLFSNRISRTLRKAHLRARCRLSAAARRAGIAWSEGPRDGALGSADTWCRARSGPRPARAEAPEGTAHSPPTHVFKTRARAAVAWSLPNHPQSLRAAPEVPGWEG